MTLLKLSMDCRSLRARDLIAKYLQRNDEHERAQRQKMMEAAGHYQGQERTSMQEQAGRAHMRWCDCPPDPVTGSRVASANMLL